MNRDQKAVVIEEIATNIQDSQAIFAVDFRGITVPQAAELRDKLREVDASFRVVKNSLTERAADQAGVAELKEHLAGPTALTFVRGDAATTAKTIADFARITQKLAFKGGVMDGVSLSAEQVSAISRLLSRQALYGQLVGLVASPLTGLVRTLNALVGGLARQLAAILEKKESGEIPAGAPPAAMTAARVAEEAPAAEPVEEIPTEVAEVAAPVEAPVEAAPTQASEAPAPAEAAPTEASDAPAPAEAAPTEASDAPAPAEAAPTEAPDAAAPAEAPAPADPAPSDTPPAAAEDQALDAPPMPVADPPAAEPPHPVEPATIPDSGDEVAGAEPAPTDEAQAEAAPADAAPATDEPTSDKENN